MPNQVFNVDDQYWDVDDWHYYAKSNQGVDAAVAIMLEEVKELQEAKESDSSVEIADALGDILFSLYGVIRALRIDAHKYKIPLKECFDEILRSNYTKLTELEDGGYEVTKREDGKILKPVNYSAPDLEPIIAQFRYFSVVNGDVDGN